MFIVGSQIRWSPRREAYPQFVETLRRAVLRQRHGARRAAARAPVLLPALAQGGAARAPTSCSSSARRSTSASTTAASRTSIPSAKIVQIDLDGAELGRNRRVDVGIDGDSGVVLEQLRGAPRSDGYQKAVGAAVADGAARREKTTSAEKMQPEIESDAEPTNPLRVCASSTPSVDDDIVIGDGGDFVAHRGVRAQARRPAVDGSRPARHARRRPRLRDGGEARAARRATSSSSTATARSASTRSSSRRWSGRRSPSSPSSATTPAGRRSAAARSSSTAPSASVATALDYTRYEKVVEALGGSGAYVEKPKEIGPALDARLGVREARAGQRQDRRQRLPQGRRSRSERWRGG